MWCDNFMQICLLKNIWKCGLEHSLFLLFFRENKGWHFMCIHMKCKALFYLKNVENYFKMSSPAVFTGLI